MRRSDCWRSYEAQVGFISFARSSTEWLSSAGRGCVVSYAMAIASVRETDRGSIGGSLEKLCDDGLMKSGSDMSQSHWLRVVECQGRNKGRSRAGVSRSVRDASVRICTAAAARPWPDRHWASTAVPRRLLFGSGHPVHPPRERKLGQEVVGIAHCCFRRLRGYNGTLDEVSHTRSGCCQAGLDCGQGGVEDEKPGRPQLLPYHYTHTHTQTSYIHTHMQYLTRACHHH